ncbi:hypothetical protein [Halomonas salipaludis]|uniref:Uncharacterized protein n=1 Tax=Halomonas salipaludis TaxID=2032625 RepID=A0A2A2ENK5_9GAMM|nr:hypothetical protein [Halomonas salipaludis]PAU73942.1 hypothetical protein CK498_25150 [Halomonas salipaludis]
MPEIEPDWVSAAATAFAGVATIAAAFTAFLAYRLQRALARSRKQLLKGDTLLKNIQSLVATFADIHATAKQDWSTERTEKLRALSARIRYTETVVKSLSPDIGTKVEEWRISSDNEGNSIPRVVDYILGGMGAIIGDKYDEFLFSKAEDLRRIQDQVFEEIGA